MNDEKNESSKTTHPKKNLSGLFRLIAFYWDYDRNHLVNSSSRQEASVKAPKSPLDWIAYINNRVWRVFVSVRLTIVLLVSLTICSVIGTIVAQQGTTQVPIESLYAAKTLKILYAFGLTDIYHSFGFIILILMLAMNLLACSLERLPKVWRDAFLTPLHVVTAEDRLFFRANTPEILEKRKILFGVIPSLEKWTVLEAQLLLDQFVKAKFPRASRELWTSKSSNGSDGSVEIGCEIGKYSRVGVYITHLSLLLIFFGGAAGAIWGFEGSIGIEEGARVSWMQHLKGTDAGMREISENGVPVKNFRNLGFEIECEAFELETYDGMRPKAFRSKLNFFENDVKVHSAVIAVNHPTVYKGMTFYQSSYSEIGVGGVDLKVYRMPETPAKSSRIKADVDGNAPSLMPKGQAPRVPLSVDLVEKARVGERYRVDGNAAFEVLQIEKDMGGPLGAGAKLRYYKSRTDDKPSEFWIFKNLPGFDFSHRSDAPLNFSIETVRPKFMTGISVARDPGVWVVWIGCLIMTAALFLALYTYHAKIWFRFSESHGFEIVGWSNKLFLFRPKFELVKNELHETVMKTNTHRRSDGEG